MKRYMLDTNIVSHLVKGHSKVDQRILNEPMVALCLSVITEAELRYGLAKRPQAKRLHSVVGELLRRVDVLPWDSACAQRYGVVRADNESRGKKLADLDLLIATHALESGTVLVTNDKAFQYVDGLPTEDWTV